MFLTLCKAETLWGCGLEGLGAWTSFYFTRGSQEMNCTMWQSTHDRNSCCCPLENVDPAFNRLFYLPIALLFFLFFFFLFFLWIDVKPEEGWPSVTSRQSSCAEQCVHVEEELRRSRGRTTYGDLSHLKAKYGKPSFILLPN